MVVTNFEITCGHDIWEARKKIWEANPAPERKLFSPSHVFDEEKSVRWNREEVERRNAETEARHDAYKKDLRESDYNLYNSIIDYIIDYFKCGDSCAKIDRDTAGIIWAKCSSDHDDDAHNWLDDYLDLINDVLNRVNR